MALSANQEISYFVDQELRLFRAANEHIYKGAWCSFESSGYLAPLTAAEKFAGLAYEECDNSTGSDGDKGVRCFTTGDFEMSLSGATIANIGAACYAGDDATLTLTSANNTFVGHIVDVPATGTVILRIQPFTTTP